ncbi:hypothetical protein GGI43DRAFT_388326 [Trichoderma evansii]
MSNSNRQRRHVQNIPTSQSVTATCSNDELDKAKEAVNSPNLFRHTPEHIREAWKDLRRSYEDSNSDDCQPFPIWALRQFEHEHISKIIRLGYYEDLGQLKSWAPSVPEFFKAEPWKFILFFNSIEQGRARILNEIIKKRERFTFNRLYEEVRLNRSNRISSQRNPKYEFLPRDFKECLKGNENQDGSDEEGDGNGDPENTKRPPINSTGSDCFDCRESGHTYNEIDAGEMVTQATPTPQSERVIRQESSHKRSPSLDHPSGGSSFTSIEKQLLKDEQSIHLSLEVLKTAVKTARETAENLVKRLEEDNAAYAEEAKQILLSANESSKDIKSALDHISFKVGNNNKRRKIEQDNMERRERLMLKLENPEFQALFNSDPRQSEAD